MNSKPERLPLFEELDGGSYSLVNLLQVLKDEDILDSTKIMKIRNLLTPVDGFVTERDIETALYSLGSSKMFVDNIIKKLKNYGVSSK